MITALKNPAILSTPLFCEAEKNTCLLFFFLSGQNLLILIFLERDTGASRPPPRRSDPREERPSVWPRSHRATAERTSTCSANDSQAHVTRERSTVSPRLQPDAHNNLRLLTIPQTCSDHGRRRRESANTCEGRTRSRLCEPPRKLTS